MHRRFSSALIPDIRSFFKPVRFHLQRPYPLIKVVLLLFLSSRLFILAGVENLWQRREQVLFPVLDLAHVNPILRSDFIGRLLTLDRFPGNICFAFFVVRLRFILNLVDLLALY